jgi:hypothetical protein
MSDGGKGSTQRPTDKQKFDENYDKIFRKKTPQELDDAKAEDDAFELIEQQNKLS